MNKNAPNPYLRTKIMTASPEELRLLLFDGCLKFCRQGQHELKQDKPNFEAIYENFMRAQKIVLELSTSLDHKVNPEVCEKLSAIYTYVYRLLVDANLERDPDKAGEAIGLLEYERDTWQMIMQKNAQDQGQVGTPTITDAGAQQTAMSSLSRSA